MSELNSLYVKRGYWLNHSRGNIMGQTITTDTETGAIIVAILAVCTALGMGHIWNIINFLVHQIRADGRPSEGLFRQQQALIRTLPTPSAQLADSLKLLFTWRGKAEPRALRHSLLLITIALIFALGSMTASIFSSYAVVGSNLEVLVSSPLCGLADSKGNNLNDFGYWSKVSVLGEQYADDCYGNDTAIPTRCNVFIKPRIMFTAETASCPFQNRHRCSSEAVAIDTGLLDFNDDFGLNLGKEENVKYRQRMTCAVLDQQNLTSVINADMLPPHVRDWDPLPGEQVQAYHLGLRPDGSNFTFGINLLHNRLSEGLSHSVYGYFRKASTSSFLGDNMFELIPELNADNADIYFHLIQKGGRVFYYTPVEDPVFAAHRQETVLDMAENVNETVYRPDAPASLIGCATEYQFCASTKAGLEKCTDLNTLSLNIAKSFPDATEHQLALLQFTAYNLYVSGYAAIRLSANEFKSYGEVTTSLPSDQWIIEMKRWVSISLARMQILLSDLAIGPAARDADAAKYYDMPPKTEGQRQLCTKQRMRKPGGFVNINVFALAFILAISITSMLTDLVLLRFFIYLTRFRRALYPYIDRWIQDGIYQLQRRAYEDQTSWLNLDKEIPVTARGVKLSDLPLTKQTSAPTPPVSSPSPRPSQGSVLPTRPGTPQSTRTSIASTANASIGAMPASPQNPSSPGSPSGNTGSTPAAPHHCFPARPWSSASSSVLPADFTPAPTNATAHIPMQTFGQAATHIRSNSGTVPIVLGYSGTPHS